MLLSAVSKMCCTPLALLGFMHEPAPQAFKSFEVAPHVAFIYFNLSQSKPDAATEAQFCFCVLQTTKTQSENIVVLFLEMDYNPFLQLRITDKYTFSKVQSFLFKMG